MTNSPAQVRNLSSACGHANHLVAPCCTLLAAQPAPVERPANAARALWLCLHGAEVCSGCRGAAHTCTGVALCRCRLARSLLTLPACSAPSAAADGCYHEAHHAGARPALSGLAGGLPAAGGPLLAASERPAGQHPPGCRQLSGAPLCRPAAPPSHPMGTPQHSHATAHSQLRYTASPGPRLRRGAAHF